MKSNLGNLDRLLRFVVGAILIVLALMKVIGAWGFIGAILIVTAFINFCPIYRLINFSSKK